MSQEGHPPPPSVPDHPLIPSEPATLVTDTEQLENVLASVRATGSFAYDTEFIGELSYYPKLCVVQIATPELVALVDPLAGVDLTGIWQVIADPALRTIVHAGAQDLEPVVRHLDAAPANIVDTQVAAAFVGQPYPASLRKLVEELLGVRLGKALTFTQWDHRPLSARHQHYAADDVRYLPALDAEIRRLLVELGHADWSDDECHQLTDPEQYRFDPQKQFWRVRGAERLDQKQLGVLLALYVLRDEIAREHDVPPRTLLKDELLVLLARTPPRSLDQLRQTRGLPRPIAEGAGQRILDAIEAGRSTPVPPRPRVPRTEDTAGQRSRIDSLYAIMSGYCRGRRIDPSLVMTRSEVAELHRSFERSRPLDRTPIMRGWRGELLAEAIIPFLRGELEISFAWERDGISCRTTAADGDGTTDASGT